MSRTLPGGLINLGAIGDGPNLRVATTDDDGERVFVETSVYSFTTDAERRALAEAHHLYPSRHDYIMSDFPMGVVGG